MMGSRLDPSDSDRLAGLADRLRLAVTRLARRLRQHADVAVSPTQLAVLATLERRGLITLGELAAAERVQPPTITAAVARLEAAGFVGRRADPDDRRVARAAITPAGKSLLAGSRSAKAAYLARRLAPLTPDERATLIEAVGLLERMLEDER